MTSISKVSIEFDGTDMTCNLDIKEENSDHIMAILRAFAIIQNSLLAEDGVDTVVEYHEAPETQLL